MSRSKYFEPNIHLNSPEILGVKQDKHIAKILLKVGTNRILKYHIVVT
jgi:hypothetical protein